ncbi:MAG: hypothetical protein K2K41_07810, partial [Ruminiclostridium sp.]|nr:hypothetical protein [Ruminiclostridium sp.]
ILDEDFKARDVAYFPAYATLVDVDADLKLKLILTSDAEGTIDNRTLIYDMEADCFSELKLPSEAYKAVYFTGQGEELRVLVLWSDGLALYTIRK